ncbi:hypothetical protein THOM_0047 [Trachipleistophora hominis]|uniref:Uncharacterized protein n=1 Tax=Trachipleistophora hominis TaxID=72359 RepID=L7JZT3_TRAHO|nr:hypothetical protein THOM_0047 [Trachipleistophora hominis]
MRKVNTKKDNNKTLDKNANTMEGNTPEKLRSATCERRLNEIPGVKGSTMKINEFYGTEVVLEIDEDEMREANNEFRFLRRGKNEDVNEELLSTEPTECDKMIGGEVSTITSRGELKALEGEIELDDKDAMNDHVSDVPIGQDDAVQSIISVEEKNHREVASCPPFSQKKTQKPKNPKKTKKKNDETLATTFKSFFSSFTPKKKNIKNVKNNTKVVFDTKTKTFKYSDFLKPEMSLDELKMFKGRVKQLIEYFEKLKEMNDHKCEGSA